MNTPTIHTKTLEALEKCAIVIAHGLTKENKWEVSTFEEVDFSICTFALGRELTTLEKGVALGLVQDRLLYLLECEDEETQPTIFTGPYFSVQSVRGLLDQWVGKRILITMDSRQGDMRGVWAGVVQKSDNNFLLVTPELRGLILVDKVTFLALLND